MKCSLPQFLFSLCLAFFPGAWAQWAAAEESPTTALTAHRILSSWNRSLDVLENSVCTTNQLEEISLPGTKSRSINYQTEQYWRERHGRLAWHRRAWNNLAAPDAPRDLHKGLNEIMVYDLKRLYTFDQTLGSRTGASDLTIREHPDLARVRAAALGLNIEGFFDEPGSRSLPDFLLSDDFKGTIDVRQAPEVVNGRKCLVLDVKGDFGKYVIWVDPSHSYQAARLELRQRAGDKINGQTLPLPSGAGRPDVVACDLKFEVREFKKIGDNWQITSAHVNRMALLRDGSSSTFDRTIERTSIDLEPVFVKLNVFEPRFPNGARVLNGTPGPKIWKDGKVVQQIDENAIRRIDEGVDAIKGSTPH